MAVTSKTDQANLTGGSDSSVSTFGWDTAYIAPYSVVNHAILTQKSYPDSFDYTDESTGARLKGKWASWQICIGGSGQNVQMECIVETGTVTSEGKGYPLDKSKLIIQVNLKNVAATDPINTSIARGGNAQALVVNTEPHGVDPAVSVIKGTYPDAITGLLKLALDQIFAGYFNANIKDFDHTFAVMDLNAVADKDGFQWIRPTAFQYAVASSEDPTLDNSAFGLIAMVDGNKISPSQQQAVDSRALDNLSEGANSAFVISESMVAKHMLMQGAIATIQGSSASDFELSSDGLSIVNNKDLVWGKFKTDHGDISPTIKKHNFTLRADDTYVLVEIVDAEYENSPGVTVHMNLTQKFTYQTVQKKNGEYIFIPDMKGLGDPKISATVSVSKGMQIAEIVMGAVTTLASLVTVGAGAAKALAGDAEVAVNETERVVQIEMQNVEEGQQAEGEVENANEEAAEGVIEGGDVAQGGGVCSSTKVRLAAGITMAVTGSAGGGMLLAKAITEARYDDIPAFNDFAANCLEGTAWPSTKGYTLISASFRSSLVLNMALDVG